jgi:redox-sensitive bicupin YhaK (pirin superfamily)
MRFRSAADVIFAEARAVGPLTVRQPLPSEQPFVMNTEDEIRAAFRDYRKGAMGIVP